MRTIVIKLISTLDHARRTTWDFIGGLDELEHDDAASVPLSSTHPTNDHRLVHVVEIHRVME